MKPTYQYKACHPLLALAFALTAQAADYNWDGTNNASWTDARWSDGTNSGVNWINGSGNTARINSGDVWSPVGITASLLTIGDGLGAPGSASARFAANNAFWGIDTITINSDGYLAGSANSTSHILTVNLNGGTIGGGDNGGAAGSYGVIALHGPVNVNGGSKTSIISTTGGGILLAGPAADTATEFNVADGSAEDDLIVSGIFVHKGFAGDSEALLKTGAGVMVLTGLNDYAGGTTVNQGTLELSGSAGGSGRIRGPLTVNSGAEVRLTNDDGTGFGYNDSRINALTIYGGSVTSEGSNWIWNIPGGVQLTGGMLASNSGTTTATGPQIEWGNTELICKASATPSTIAGRLNIRREAASLLRVNVADGAAATDLEISASLTESAAGCGLVKSGSGTLKISGAVILTGFITVEAGTLDLSSATPGTCIHINVLSGARFIPPVSGLPANAAVFINGEKLEPGTWGAPGSVAAGTARYESPVLAGSTAMVVSYTGLSRRERWKTLKYGIFSHYVWWGYDGTVDINGVHPTSADDVASKFNAAQYADDCVTAGAQYVVFTAWHANTLPLWPSAVMQRWAPWASVPTQRDVVSDAIDACKARGLRVFLYTHPYQPVVADQNGFINELYTETIERYGSRIDGLWIDENTLDGTQDSLVDYKRLITTIKQLNPDLVTMQNGGQTYTVDMGGPEVVGSWNFGWSECMYNLIHSQPGLTSEDMFRTNVLSAAANFEGGGVHWCIDGVGLGGLSETSRAFAVGRYLSPVRESVCDTKPSASFPPPYKDGRQITYNTVDWVATTSTDESKEFIHVLKPQSGNTITLPATADGKVFSSATLLASLQPNGATQTYLGTAMTMIQTPRGIKLTLPSGVSWSTLDTVIQLNVASKGGAGMVNDTSAAITYSGSSWIYQSHRGFGEFNDDLHTTTANGDSFTVTFTGTDIEYIASREANRGPVDIFIDNVFQTTVDLSSGPALGSRQTAFRKSGLARGQHTLKCVKKGGTYMDADCFKVTELINDSDPDVSFPITASYGADAAARPNGSLWERGNGGWLTPQTGSYPAPTPPNGDYFEFTFTGTEVQAHLSSAFGSGNYVMYVDGVYHGTANVGGPVIYSVTGLANGTHTIKGVTATTNPNGFIASFSGFTVTRPDQWTAQSGRGYGEIGDDVHYTDSNPVGFSYNFNGSGVEIITTRDQDARMAWFGVSGQGLNIGARRNNFSLKRQTGTSAFSVPNLMPGNYSVSASHGANMSGLNFSFARLAIDAIRVYKGESLSSAPLYWGSSGNGGSGTWDLGSTANWYDGGASTAWHDFGGSDYSAEFTGTAGTVSLASNINVNRLTIQSAGYTLQGNSLTLTGTNPVITANANSTISSTLNGSSGLTKSGLGKLSLPGINTYGGSTEVAAGTLEITQPSADNGGFTSIGSGPVNIRSGGTLLSSGNWATGNDWNTGAVGKITIDQGGTWHITAIGGTVRNGLELRGGQVTSAGQANADWGVLHLKSEISATSGQSSTIAVDTALSGSRSVFVDAASTLFFSGKIHNQIATTGALAKTGTGTLILSGANTYTGSTAIDAGKLILSGSLNNTSTVTIASGAELEISGSLSASGNIVNNGTMILTGAPQLTSGGTITNNGTIINRSPSYSLPANVVNSGTIYNLPAAPTGLVATPRDAQVTLTWNAVSTATSYNVKQSISFGGPYTTVTTSSTTSKSVTGLTNGVAYYFVVSASNATGEGANSDQATAVPISLPAPRVSSDIGSVGIPGSASFSSGTYTIQGAGAGVYASTDAFRYVYQPSSGDCSVAVRVQSLTNTSVSAKTGVMIRESLAANARCAGVYVTPSSGIQLIWRSTTGSMVSIATKSGLVAPYWVRLNRTGNSFSAYYSSNGSTWTQLSNNKTISMAASTSIGTAITSGTTSAFATGVLTNETVTP
jgi:autotransporter-associated beta strand protein